MTRPRKLVTQNFVNSNEGRNCDICVITIFGDICTRSFLALAFQFQIARKKTLYSFGVKIATCGFCYH